MHPEKLTGVREEIRDVMTYLTESTENPGVGPVEAAEAKVDMNGGKYPAAPMKGEASKYAEYR